MFFSFFFSSLEEQNKTYLINLMRLFQQNYLDDQFVSESMGF